MEAARLINQTYRGKRVQIFTDSRSAVQAVKNPIVDSRVVLDCKVACKTVVENGGSLDLKWIKGHNGNIFNELADRLAKEGARMPPIARCQLQEPWSNLRRRLRERANDEWQDRWSSTKACGQIRGFFERVENTPANFLMSCGRRDLKIMVQVLTGHNQLRYQLHKMGKAATPLCRLCNKANETSAHLIWHCQVLERPRLDYWVQNEPGKLPGLAKLLRFSRDKLAEMLGTPPPPCD